MNAMKRLFLAAALSGGALAASTAAVLAQEAQPTPAPEASPTLMDRQYDGNLHIQLAPYIWAPTVHGNFQYSIPTVSNPKHGITQTSITVKPADYAANINSAAMFSFDARKGAADVFGDFIYVNASASASASAIASGRLGRIQIPINLSTTSHLRSSIWELAAGYTFARGHNADLSIFGGLREYPLNLTLDYNATVGKRGIIARSGSVASDSIAQDVIFGLRGKAFLGDHWYVPYYVDYGTGIGQLSNQTWQAFSGAGYAFPHGQALILAYRALSYSGFAPISNVQKLTLSGPLLGYTFNL